MDRVKDLPKTTYSIPVSNGLFAHREKIGPAIWVFLWLIDATTKEIPGVDGKAEGLVYGGRPLPLGAIAADLKMSWRSTYEQLAQLVEGGYIRKIENGNGRANGYAVVNSKRFARRGKSRDANAVTSVRNSIGTTEENLTGAPEEKCVDLCRKTSVPMQKSATYNKEEGLQDNTRQEDIEPDDPSVAARLLCKECGNFDMHFLGDRAEQIKAEAKDRGISCKAVADLMISRWRLYNSSRPRLNYPVQSAGKFWTSGTWDNTACWPWKPDAIPVGLSPEPKFNDPIAQLAALGVPAKRAM